MEDINGEEEINGISFTTASKFMKMSISHEKLTRQMQTGESIHWMMKMQTD